MKRIFKIGGFAGIALLLFLASAVVAFGYGDEFDLTAVNTAEGIKLDWIEQNDVYFYEVYRQTGKNGEKVLLSKVNDITYVDSEAEDGKGYIYTVMPVKNDYSYASRVGLVTVYRIGTVKITEACSEKAGLRIEWAAVRLATEYRVLRKAGDDSEWTEIAKCPKEKTFYVDGNVEAEQKYTYAVKAVAGDYEGEILDEVTLQYIAYPKITGCVSAEKGIRLNWSKVPSAVYYLVYRKSGADAPWKPYALLDSEFTGYEDKDVKNSVTYSYTVRAVDENETKSHYDDAFPIRFMAKPEIKAAQSDTDGVRLTWTRSEGCDGYAVFRKEFAWGSWRLVCLTDDEAATSAVDAFAKDDTAYTYTVRAMWNKNLSAYDEKGVTVRFMRAPEGLECFANTKHGNVLRWQNNDKATAFFVYRRVEEGKWKAIGKTDKSIFADKKAHRDGRYFYTVKAYNSSVFQSGAAKAVKTFKDGINPKGKMVALTFDDGPSDSITNGVLDVLEKYRAKATFFVVGQNIYYGRNAMKRAAKMGCEIGTHTYSHIDLPSSSSSTIREEIAWTDDLIREYTGSPATVARAPGGALDSSSAATVGKPFFYWSVDTRDWESRDASSVISIVKNNAADGDIILMHDVYESTLEAVETVVPWLISEGYQLVTVSELMQYKGGIIPKAGVQYYDGFGE